MPIFIYRGRYSADAVKGMMTSPEDREAALAKVFEKAGGKLLAFYLTFGEDDFLTIADCPDHRAALALAIAGAAGEQHQRHENDGRRDLERGDGRIQKGWGIGQNVEERGTLTRSRRQSRFSRLAVCSQAVAGMKRSEIRERLASLSVSPGFR